MLPSYACGVSLTTHIPSLIVEGGRVTDCCVLRLREVDCSPIATTIDPAVVRLTDCRGTERSREYTMHCVNYGQSTLECWRMLVLLSVG